MRSTEPSGTADLSQDLPPLPPDVQCLIDLYSRSSERLGVLWMMFRFHAYCDSNSVFPHFLSSPFGYNEEIGEELSQEDRSALIWEVVTHIIVMLHATTEDAIRTVAGIRLPSSDPAALSRIPVLHADGKRREPPKGLAALAPHRALSVESLLKASIESWLDTQSFSTVKQLTEMWELLALPVGPLRPYFSMFEDIARLRHDIAHTGDIDEKHLPKIPDGETFERMICSTYLLLRTVVSEVIPAEHRNRFLVTAIIQEELNKRRGLEVPPPTI